MMPAVTSVRHSKLTVSIVSGGHVVVGVAEVGCVREHEPRITSLDEPGVVRTIDVSDKLGGSHAIRWELCALTKQLDALADPRSRLVIANEEDEVADSWVHPGDRLGILLACRLIRKISEHLKRDHADDVVTVSLASLGIVTAAHIAAQLMIGQFLGRSVLALFVGESNQTQRASKPTTTQLSSQLQ